MQAPVTWPRRFDEWLTTSVEHTLHLTKIGIVYLVRENHIDFVRAALAW